GIWRGAFPAESSSKDWNVKSSVKSSLYSWTPRFTQHHWNSLTAFCAVVGEGAALTARCWERITGENGLKQPAAASAVASAARGGTMRRMDVLLRAVIERRTPFATSSSSACPTTG